MSAKSVEVQHELLVLGFRAYSRGLAGNIAFGALTVAFLWPVLSHAGLAAWLAVLVALAVLRLSIARAFLREAVPVSDPGRWALRAAITTGLSGLAWGTLAAITILLAPEAPVYAMWTILLIVLFSVLGAQTTASHPWAFRAYVLAGMVPVLVMSAIAASPNPTVRLLAEAMLTVLCWMVGSSGNAYVVESIAMRFENVELLRDLSQQKEALGRANAAKTRFLAAASHDLRQPMQALVLLVESLRERVKDPTNRHIAASIHATVESMSVLLNEILDISRLDAGTVSPQRVSFPIATVLDRLRAAYTYPAARKELALRVRDSECIVNTDPVLLHRIVVNLVENALRYTRRGGVLVACRRRAEGLWIEVWDTGVGIPEDQFEAVFHEFHQLGNPHRDRDQGFGLGLAIVDRTAKLLQLPLELRSRVGRGSVFRLRIPYGDPLQVKVPEPVRAPAALEGSCVVVVEDDMEIRAAMLLLLEGWGCQVHAAASGPELDRVLAGMPGPPDAIVADFRLPGEETGVDIVLRVRKRFPRALGILVSGDVSPAVLRAAREAGIELLHKPLKPARLRALLGSMRSVTEGV